MSTKCNICNNLVEDGNCFTCYPDEHYCFCECHQVSDFTCGQCSDSCQLANTKCKHDTRDYSPMKTKFKCLDCGHLFFTKTLEMIF